MKYACVLLADNHPPMLASVRILLEDLFSVVVMAADAASLFEAVVKMTPDVVVVDLSLPVVGNSNIMLPWVVPLTTVFKPHSPGFHIRARRLYTPYGVIGQVQFYLPLLKSSFVQRTLSK